MLWNFVFKYRTLQKLQDYRNGLIYVFEMGIVAAEWKFPPDFVLFTASYYKTKFKKDFVSLDPSWWPDMRGINVATCVHRESWVYK